MPLQFKTYKIFAWQSAILASLLLFAGCKHNNLSQMQNENVSSQQTTDANGDQPATEDWPDSSIGAREHTNVIRAYNGIYRNNALEAWLGTVLNRLIHSTEIENREFRLTILDSPEINAFALPGGYLYVTRGLITLANSESEVAAVLAHEMAHIIARHAIARIHRVENTLTAKRIADLTYSDSSAQLALLASRQDYARFTQEQELEADRIGMSLMIKAGFDPHAAAGLLRNMETYSRYLSEGTNGSQNDALINSHPATPERLRNAVSEARKYGLPGIGGTKREQYLQQINGVIFGPSQEQSVIVGQHYYQPLLKFRLSVPPGYLIEDKKSTVIASNQSGQAIRFEPVDMPKGQNLSDFLTADWIRGLDRTTIKSTTINQFPAVTARARVGNWHFFIALIRFQDRAYRFVLASQSNTAVEEADFHSTIHSFRGISDEEIRSIKYPRIIIRKVAPGETVPYIAAKMPVSGNREILFRALNGLSVQSTVRTGQLVKTVGF